VLPKTRALLDRENLPAGEYRCRCAPRRLQGRRPKIRRQSHGRSERLPTASRCSPQIRWTETPAAGLRFCPTKKERTPCLEVAGVATASSPRWRAGWCGDEGRLARTALTSCGSHALIASRSQRLQRSAATTSLLSEPPFSARPTAAQVPARPPDLPVYKGHGVHSPRRGRSRSYMWTSRCGPHRFPWDLGTGDKDGFRWTPEYGRQQGHDGFLRRPAEH